MSETKHTPAPWHWERKSGVEEPHALVGPRDELILFAAVDADGVDGTLRAIIHSYSVPHDAGDMDLIANAPTLLAQRDRLLEVARMGVKYESEMAAVRARLVGVRIARPKPSETAGNLHAAWVAATKAVVAEVEKADA